MPDWKAPLSAITGARHGGQVGSSLEPLRALDARFPNVAEINYQLAWTCDALGRAAEAVPIYEKAIALGLPPHELSGALLGLGSTLRSLGRHDRAAEVLESGRAQFPGHREFDVFLALALHDLGRHAEAMQLLLSVIADTADDPGLTAYQRAIRHHAENL
ncbi:MAG: tetratricopeptide repeat protein [Opitutales bacterium]